MIPSAAWILTPPPPLAHPNTTGKPITSARWVARRLSIKSLKNISAKPTNTLTSIRSLLFSSNGLSKRWAILLFVSGKVRIKNFTHSLFCLYIIFNNTWYSRIIKKGVNHVSHVDRPLNIDRIGGLRHLWQQSCHCFETCRQPLLPALQSSGAK
jgi:hypothetical protein